MKKKAILTVTVVILLVIFGFSAFRIVNYLVEGKQQQDRSNELSNIVANAQQTPSTTPETEPAEVTEAPTESSTDPTTEPTTVPTEPVMIDAYKEIYEQNSDTVGWIKIEGTKLNYPVLQTPNDPNFYLYRDFDKNSNQWGSVYAWSACDINKPSDNITLFGHNMKDGSMFACLHNYIKKETWEENPLVFFDTLYEFHTYKIFAVFHTSGYDGVGFPYHQYVDAGNQASFDKFVSTCKELAYYDTGITPVYGDKIICLSTCEYTIDNGRLVVAAVRIT